LIGKAIASQVGATFFNISSSSLTIKWIGEGEKTVRAFFVIANLRKPSVVFVDDVDSLLCQRSSDENEASRRLKTEFLVQLDGAGTSEDARVVIIGATNRPEEIDEAARRRFVKRIYIPLPDAEGRKQLFERLLGPVLPHRGSQELSIDVLVTRTEGFSGADIRSLCTEAAMGPMREIAATHGNNLLHISADDVSSIAMRHFDEALEAVAPSVSQADLTRYLQWNAEFGSFRKLSL
jgi:SpoVK/Ycf46/Vps4 family AAA+-type ATPase